ncbi:hypothetical protein [Burkholderia sp. MSMB1589WGS]|uniref:hypothetical protein n=1 Tax=Burkholderia sp. MSMB1589WGS TaxID=1636425 RepID=UPI0009ED7FF9|nr:hypothetical protein [Burkholderia sp. MSMB1589WGS]
MRATRAAVAPGRAREHAKPRRPDARDVGLTVWSVGDSMPNVVQPRAPQASPGAIANIPRITRHYPFFRDIGDRGR